MTQAYGKGAPCLSEAAPRLCYNHAMLISEAGEFGLIAAITRLIDRHGRRDLPSGQGLIIGAGDDAAAWKPEKGIELATTDIMVEGTHFNLSSIKWRELGWKSIAVNISDIAAMGGSPRYALVSLALPSHLRVADILEMYRGMLDICNRYSIAIVGGNISSAPQISVSVALTGISRRIPLTRSAAQAGDLIAVTGYPGLSSAGLKAATSSIGLPARTARLLHEAHFHPMPQVEAGERLSMLGVKVAIDTSDGLLADLVHICECSQKSAVIYVQSLPIHPALKRCFPQDYLNLVLSGGEDYALLFTAGSEKMQKAKELLSLPVTVIGEITTGKAGKISVLDGRGKPVKISAPGWDHYSHQYAIR